MWVIVVTIQGMNNIKLEDVGRFCKNVTQVGLSMPVL
jgi:hypothetical protein